MEQEIPQGPGNADSTIEQVPGQSTIEQELAAQTSAALDAGLRTELDHAVLLGTADAATALDAAAAFEPAPPTAQELTGDVPDANSSEDGGAGDGNPDDLQMITRPGEGSAGSSTMHVDTVVTYDQIYDSIGKQAQDRNVHELSKVLCDLGYIDVVQPVGQQYYPRKAVAEFQRDAGLPADGRYTRETHDKIFSI